MSWGLTLGVTGAWEPGTVDITDIVGGLVIRTEVHGGVQSIAFDIVDCWIDAYRWAYDHIGAKVYVFDNSLNPPVAEARIFEPAISQDGNRITAFGPWLAYMFNQIYNDTATWVAAGQTGAQIKAILSGECPDVSTDQTNIDEPGTNNWPWQPSDNAYPGDLIPQLAALSDASNNDWYFWLRSAPLSGNAPRSPIAWFKSESSIDQIYQCWREDMAPGALDLTPSLRDLANDVRVMYRDAAGTQHQTGSATDADSQTRYGLRERWDMDLGPASAAAAAQYRGLLLDRSRDPQQSANFTLNTWLYDRRGGRWPLWRAIADFPFRFTVNDLIPDVDVATHTVDHKRTFITLACEYDYDSNELTITPDTQDNRADALLARHRTFQ